VTQNQNASTDKASNPGDGAAARWSNSHWWATPIVRLESCPDASFNAALARIVFEQEQLIVKQGQPSRVAGLDQGLTTHWQEYNVLNWDYPECRKLRQLVLDGYQSFIEFIGRKGDPGLEITGISCWANVLRAGQALQVHHHDPAFASAHYTVHPGHTEDDIAQGEAGNTVYFRPGFMDRSHGGKQNGAVSPWDADWRISRPPRAGSLVFFPSYVRHEVLPHHAKAPRISIALDIFVKEQELLMYFGGARWFVPGKNH
jgi:hypothetical protein